MSKMKKPARDGARDRPEFKANDAENIAQPTGFREEFAEYRTFDYGQVAEDLAGELRQSAGVIRQAIPLKARGIVQVGEILIEIKAKLPPRQFLAWAEAACGASRRTVQRYMQVAKTMASKSDIVSLFELTPLYLLAAAPKEVREEVLDRAAAGEIIPQMGIKGRIALAKTIGSTRH